MQRGGDGMDGGKTYRSGKAEFAGGAGSGRRSDPPGGAEPGRGAEPPGEANLNGRTDPAHSVRTAGASDTAGEGGFGEEILLTGRCLLELLRDSLCPAYVRDRDNVLLTAPWEEEDYRVGVYLYDIQDYSLAVSAPDDTGGDTLRFPPKALELSYMLFCNEKHRFGGLQRERIQGILTEIVRAVYDHPRLTREDGETVEFFFLRESVEFKIRLWGSFNQPLQPAVYVRAAPVAVASARTRKANRVRERDYGLEKM